MDTTEFIKASRLLHGNKYDYSKVIYTNRDAKVIIICPIHGEFSQNARSHCKRGFGCDRCGKTEAWASRKTSTEEFLARAKEKHGDRYDYSKVEYKGSTVKVPIICKKHGEFMQTPSAHYGGYGCSKCGKDNAALVTGYTNDEFVKLAKAVHGEKYDYSRAVYTKSRNDIEIVCPEHGPFWQLANGHLHGRGCQKCGLKSRILKRTHTKKQFVKLATKVHGDRYDYSRAVYVNTYTDVEIVCPDHGPFWQSPNCHVCQESECPKCGILIRNDKNRVTLDEFIERANNVHGNKYDYSLVKMPKRGRGKVEIICTIHGPYNQAANNHMRGHGCAKCYFDRTRGVPIKPEEEFLTECIAIHGNKYDYSYVDYRGTKKKVKIICPDHGGFFITPNYHQRGGECPTCADFRITMEEFLERCKVKHGNFYDYSLVNFERMSDKVEIICPHHGVFRQSASSHSSGHGCQNCRRIVSAGEIEFLNHIGVPVKDRQVFIPSLNCVVDGMRVNENVIYEYLGDYWHGNPAMFHPATKIRGSNKTCEDAYAETFVRFNKLKEIGYNIKYIWESDWTAWKNDPAGSIPIKHHHS